jgi:hypothetical protein
MPETLAFNQYRIAMAFSDSISIGWQSFTVVRGCAKVADAW